METDSDGFSKDLANEMTALSKEYVYFLKFYISIVLMNNNDFF